MRYFLVILLAFYLCACGFSSPSPKDEEDSNLPVVKTFRALPDVSSIGFEWQAPSDTHLISGYAIYRKNDKGEFIRVASIGNAHSTHYYDSALKQQSEYEYTIATIGLDSKISKKATPIKVKTSFIDPVSFVYASNNLASQIKIFWSPSPNPVVKNYIIEKKTPKGFIPIGTTNNRMLVEFFDNNLPSDTECEYRIISQSYDGAKSLPSQVVKGHTKAPPKEIVQIKATQNKPKAIYVEWQPSDDKDVIGYNVWSSDSSGVYNKIGFVQGASFNHSVEGDGEIRFYKITAVDRYKLESKMQNEGVKGQSLPPPPTPKITRNVLENNIFTLTWEKLQDPRVEKYIVYRLSPTQSSKFNVDSQTKFIDNDLKPGVTYTYYVVSVDKLDIQSLPSRKISIMVDIGEPMESNQPVLESNAVEVDSKVKKP